MSGTHLTCRRGLLQPHPFAYIANISQNAWAFKLPFPGSYDIFFNIFFISYSYKNIFFILIAHFIKIVGKEENMASNRHRK